MHPFEKLTAWQKAHELALCTLRTVARSKGTNFQVLADQLRRAAIAVPANIAEGSGRSSAAQFASFLSVAIASARKVSYLAHLAADVEMINPSDRALIEARCDQVIRMLVSLLRHLRSKPPTVGRTRRLKAAAIDG